MSVACLDIPMDEALLVQNIQCLTIQKKSGLPSIPSLITVIFHDSYSSSPKYIYIYIWWSYMLQVAYCHIHLCAWVHMFMTYPYGPNVVDTLVGKPHLSAGGSEQKHHYQLPINHVQVITIFPQLQHRYQIIHQPSCINDTMWGPPVMFVGL